MNALLSKVQTKLQEARISDVNHELGKVKENLISESSSYLQNLRTDAATVGTLIRSESTRFSNLLSGAASWSRTPSGPKGPAPTSLSLPKSTSLPAISAVQSRGGDNNPKYVYRSSLCSPPEDPKESEEDSSIDEAVADRLIRVVENKEQQPSYSSTHAAPRRAARHLDTREDIRRKLAFSSSSTSDPNQTGTGYRKGFQQGSRSGENSDLQICFINEAVTDEEEEEGKKEKDRREEEEHHRAAEDSSEDQEEEEEVGERRGIFPRSRSDWEAFRNPDSQLRLSHPVPSSSREEGRSGRLLRKKLNKLQAEVRLNLQDCQQIAKTHIEKERRRRLEDNPLKKLIGISPESLTKSKLHQLNIASLQVILNYYHAEIERLNEELVTLLLDKDDLQIEQDSQLLDVEDLSHSFRYADDFHSPL